jgi:hypothetical protein
MMDSLAALQSSLAAITKAKVRPLLELNDNLRSHLSGIADINVTTIVHIGDQSHGKSSTAEAHICAELPKGEGIKTLLPLSVRIRRAESVEDVFGIVDGQKCPAGDFSSFVEAATEQRIGTSKDIQDVPLETEMWLPDADEMTILDLPGMTRVAVEGQSLTDTQLEDVISTMYQKYCAPVEAIIVVVVSMMVDFTTSSSLQLARKMDPSWERTVLVVTHLDAYVMQSENVVDRVLQQAKKCCPPIPESSIFCVRNRTKTERESGVSLSGALSKSDDFFETHPQAKFFPAHMKGIRRLSSFLAQLYQDRIVKTLVPKSKDIDARLQDLEIESAAMGFAPKTLGECVAVFSQRQGAMFRMMREQCHGRGFMPEEVTEGHLFELQLEVNDLPKLRAENTVVKGRPVSSSLGEWQMSLLPNGASNVSARDSGRVTTSVELILIPVENLEFGEIEGELVFQSGSEQRTTEIHGEYKESDKHTFVWTEEVDFVKADSYKLAASILVTNKKFVGAAGNALASRMFCAVLADLERAFETNLHCAYSLNFFFSKVMRTKLMNHRMMRDGALCLRGASLPEPPLEILKSLQQALVPIVKEHVQNVAENVQQFIHKVIAKVFRDFSKLKSCLTNSASIAIEEKKLKCKEMADMCLRMELQQVHYSCNSRPSNAFLSASLLEHMKKLKEGTLVRVPTELSTLEDLSDLNFASRVIDMSENCISEHVQLFVYWLALLDRVSSFIIMTTRDTLVNQPIIGHPERRPPIAPQLEQALAHGVEDAGGLTQLMHLDEAILRRRVKLDEQLDALRRAKGELQKWVRHNDSDQSPLGSTLP